MLNRNLAQQISAEKERALHDADGGHFLIGVILRNFLSHFPDALCYLPARIQSF